jgi:hypothetical protein
VLGRDGPAVENSRGKKRANPIRARPSYLNKRLFLFKLHLNFDETFSPERNLTI